MVAPCRVMAMGVAYQRGGARFFDVTKVMPEHEHSERHGGVLGMSGELHVEAVALRTGEIRVYLSDAFRQPLRVANQIGEVEIEAAGGGGNAPQRLPLEPGPAGAYLRARSTGPFQGPNVNVTVRLASPHEFMMTFPLQPLDPSRKSGHM